jgi:hypothetical protein
VAQTKNDDQEIISHGTFKPDCKQSMAGWYISGGPYSLVSDPLLAGSVRVVSILACYADMNIGINDYERLFRLIRTADSAAQLQKLSPE